MNNTVSPSDTGLPAAAAPGSTTPAVRVAAGQRWRAWTAAACLVLLPMLVAPELAFSGPASMRPLFLHKVSEGDAGAVADVLAKRGIQYTVSPRGRIMVPSDLADRLRIDLALLGYPSGPGLVHKGAKPPRRELWPSEDIASYKAAFEAELARVITTLEPVEAARVLLSSPPRKGDCSDSDPVQPIASVTVRLRPGQALDDSQLAGIVHLVHRSVPGLSASNVSVIDDQGQLLLLREPAASAR